MRPSPQTLRSRGVRGELWLMPRVLRSRSRRPAASASTVTTREAQWREWWFACENPEALKVLASSPFAPAASVDVATPKPKWSPKAPVECAGRTAASFAAERGNVAMLETLEALGAQLFLSDANNCSPLHHAAAHNQSEAVEWLAARASQAELDAGDVDGMTPLIIAAWAGYGDVVRVFVEETSAGLLCTDVNGATAAAHCAQRRMLPELGLLLQRMGRGGGAVRGSRTFRADRARLERHLKLLPSNELAAVAKAWRIREIPTTTASADMIGALLRLSE